MTESQSNPKAAGIKDTLESIIIALILAFVFRCFFVEAFVIPTGSMAPTLLGANMRFKCPDCAWDFTTNFSAPQIPGTDNIVIPNRASTVVPRVDENGRRLLTQDNRQLLAEVPTPFAITCPNCGFKLPKPDSTGPAVHYGDRILVLKYASLLEAPQRWDVIVFRSPFDQRSNDRIPRPQNQPEFQQNYIKRLIGLPGEQVLLLDGDVYTRTADNQPWTVQAKPKRAQDALWRIVSDLDHLPRGLSRGGQPNFQVPWIAPTDTQPLTPAPGGRAFTSPATGTAGLTFDAAANPRKSAFTDWLAFNSTQPQQESLGTATSESIKRFYDDWRESAGAHVVSDILLRATVERQSAASSGNVDLVLTKRNDKFIARLSDRATLLHVKPGGTETKLAEAPLPQGTLDIDFQNVDYRVTLRVNGRELLATTPAQYAPDVAALQAESTSHQIPPKPTVSIYTNNLATRISHLSVWRDVYYINNGNSYRDPAWGSPDSPITLGQGEYFPLGDNSALSLDARFWKNPIDLPAEGLEVEGGRVPERFMLGKAFFVYWPAGYRLSENTPGVIPNFGQMRLIH